MLKIYKDEDVDEAILEGKTIAIIGYGNQGRAQALNIRDSGFNVVVGELKGSTAWKKAEKDGFEVSNAEEASKKAEIIQFLTQDTVQPDVYRNEIRKNLTQGKTLGFSHGFNIHYGLIRPPQDIDVILIAPKAPGLILRESFKQGSGVPGLIAVEQDYTGKAKETALAMAKAMGLTRRGVIETTFKEEVETDLFGEQVVLCGGVTELIKAGFETLVEAGYQPEIAYFECLNELKLIVDLIWSSGLEGMWKAVSDTAEYGGRTRGSIIIDKGARDKMKKILEDIQTGRFAREWINEYKTNQIVLNSLRKRDEQHLIEKVGDKIRKLQGI